ncbi:BLUF domain-containing protein [Parasphingorhabdus sp.]|uniref:BLUF domain-containing protein n=1 Tax=Parasphingorhabdus sp. TaxID=2709688 RepID=UPI0035935CD6
MTLERLLYISESRLGEAEVNSSVAQIVADAQIRNAALELTGALLFTGTYFAQILEGPTESIEQLMSSIKDDPRHANIIIVDRSPIEMRRFPDWKMAYHGPSEFVSRHVVRLLHSPPRSEQRRATEWLTELAHEFSVGPLPIRNLNRS